MRTGIRDHYLANGLTENFTYYYLLISLLYVSISVILFYILTWEISCSWREICISFDNVMETEN